MSVDPWLCSMAGAAVVTLLFLAALSAMETAVLNARRSRLPQATGPGVEPGTTAAIAKRAEAVIEASDRFQASAHLAKTLCEAIFYTLAALIGLQAGLALQPPGEGETVRLLLERAWPLVAGAAVLGYLLVTVFGEALPKAMSARAPERLLIATAPFIQAFTLVFTPIRWLTTRLARSFHHQSGSDPPLTARAAHSEQEIMLLVEGSAEEGVLEDDEKEMIESIFEFTDTVARQVMTPRIDVDSVSADAPLDDALRIAMESGHSRLVAYEETLDNVIGVIHVKDLLAPLLEGRRDQSLRPLLREPYFVPEAKRLDELLHEMRRSKSHIAIVVDEYGGTSGVVTVEDILEEIVGEIQDEYDTEEHPLAEPDDEGTGGLVDARMTIDDVNERLGLQLPHGDYETLAGFVFSLFGRPPEVGDRVAYNGHEFVAEALDGLRIAKVRIVATPAETEE